ncbi:hypothetical protein [Streptomyces sp. TP-A0356]|uniref:hypothetical protein n=1 Tax=Streptomyces sp. TP-A0356 TaxID=1359208 RepID=UPI00352A3CF2
MTGRIVLGAVVGVVVIGTVSAHTGKGAAGNGERGSSGSRVQGSRPMSDRASGHTGEKGAGAEEEAGTRSAPRGDGSYVVGRDVRPGTYRTTGNTDGLCYWERAKDASGGADSLIANDNVTGTSYVTVKATDKVFRSSGCKDWQAVGEKTAGATTGARIDGDGGMYRVGVDIAPGTYRSTGNSGDLCYWERAKDALHSVESVSANDNVSGSAVVTISAGDAYFKTVGCGDWKKTS